MDIRLTWTDPPSRMAGTLEIYRARIVDGLHAIADAFAARIVALAKQIAPWNDQTGAARRGLTGTAEKAAVAATIRVFHTVSYGVYLEAGSRHASPRPSIMPAMQQTYAALMAALRALVS